MNNELMRKYISILEDSSNSNLSTMWATHAVNSCIMGNLGQSGAVDAEDGPEYRAENERLLGMVANQAGPEIADKLTKWSDYLCKRVHLKRGPSFDALFNALAQWGVDANHVYDQLDAVIDLESATRTWGGRGNKAPVRPSAYGVQEGSEEQYVACQVNFNRSGSSSVRRTKPMSKQQAEAVVADALAKSTFKYPQFMTIYPDAAGRPDASEIMSTYPNMSDIGTPR